MNYMRSLDASRIVIASITIAIMAVVTDWRFNDAMQASMRQGRFEPFSALGNALFVAACVGVIIMLVYATLMHIYNGNIRIVRLAMAGIVLALGAGIGTHWVWTTYVTEYGAAARHIVTRATYMEDATLIGWLMFALVFAVCCSAAAHYVEHRS